MGGILGGLSDALFGSPKAPEAPDYSGAAEATAQGNIEAARIATRANRPTQITPWGTSTWTQTPDTAGYQQALSDWEKGLAELGERPSGNFGNFQTQWDQRRAALGDRPLESAFPSDFWTQTVELSPEQQRLFDLDQQMSTRMGEVGLAGLNTASDLFSSRYQTPEGAALPTYGENRQQVIDAMMQRSGRALEQEKEAVHSNLIAAGIPPGSEAYNREMRRIDEKSVDARQQAEIAAANMATQEYRTAMDRAQQIISNALLERQTPLNELNALRTGTQVQSPQFGQFSQQGTTAGPDVMGATMAQGQWDMGQYNSQQAQQNAIMSGLFGIGSAYMGRPG